MTECCWETGDCRYRQHRPGGGGSTDKLGIRTNLAQAAVPKTMAPYKAGYDYFHGGSVSGRGHCAGAGGQT